MGAHRSLIVLRQVVLVHIAVLGLGLLSPAGRQAVLGQTLLLGEGDSWYFFRGREAPPADWAEPTFDPEAYGWELGATGIGYADDDDATVLDDMMNSYLTVFVRTDFQVPQAVEGNDWLVRVRYDDGFVVYVDGVEVLRRNVAGTPPGFDEPATDTHEILAPGGFDETIPIANGPDLFPPGMHVIAASVHNATIDSTDLSFSLELVARTPSQGSQTGLVFDGSQFATASPFRQALPEGTFEAWFRRAQDNRDIWRAVFGVEAEAGGDTLRIDVRNARVRARILVGGEPQTLTGEVELPVDTWHHLAFSFTGTDRKLYVDGALVASDAGAVEIASGLPFRLGRGSGFVGSFRGAVDCVRIWSVARDAGAIGLERFALPVDGEGLEAAWYLDEGAGGTAGDSGPWMNALDLGEGPGAEASDPQWAVFEDFPSFALTGIVPGAGPLSGGNTVEVWGTGFSAEQPPDVLFGGVPATSVEVVEPWKLTAVVPAGAAYGRVAVLVDGPAGSAELVNGYMYQPDSLHDFVREGDIWSYFIGTEAPPVDWNSPDADPRAWDWLEGPSGLGYGDGDDATDLPQMENASLTLYARTSWEMAGRGDQIQYFRLRIRYDDGYVAYLNGNEIARAYVAGYPPTYDEPASDLHEIAGGAGTFDEEIDVIEFQEFLRRGVNTLAIEVHNMTLDSSDLSLSAELIYAASGKDFLRGDADMDGMRAITDAIVILRWLFMGDDLNCLEAADVDDDGALNLGDPVYLLYFLFRDGPPPGLPYDEPMPDLDEDAFGCEG